MDRSLVDKARHLLNQNLPSTTLSTVDKDFNVNVAVISILEMIDDETILCARFGADKTYANLKETGKGVFMVLVFDQNQSKDGIRVAVELAGDETEGPNFEMMNKKLQASRYGRFPLKNCLIFKIKAIMPVSSLNYRA